MKMIREVNRALLNPYQLGEIKQMIHAFELCYAAGQKSRAAGNRFICHRLNALCDGRRITPEARGRCTQLVMTALGGQLAKTVLGGPATLNVWWWRQLPEAERGRCWPDDMPKHYRQLWLKQIIKDLCWLLK